MKTHVPGVAIEDLRGIARADLAGFTPITVLTGPNGCGKSTVLDALLVGGSPTPGAAVAQAVTRRGRSADPGMWFVRAGMAGAGVDVCGWRRRVVPSTPTGAARRLMVDTILHHAHAGRSVVEVSPTGAASWSESRAPEVSFKAHLIDPGTPAALEPSFSAAVRAGLKEPIIALLRELLPAATGLEILLDGAGAPTLYVAYPSGAIPVAFAGDGIRAFLQLAFELAHADAGVALVEEPESFLHPAAMLRAAQAIVAAARRDTQVVLTTHSLEFIDALVGALGPDVAALSVFNLALVDGELRSSRIAGDDVRFARDEVEKDLR